VVRLTVDLTQNLYDCLEEKARQRQRERGGRSSTAALRRRPGAGRQARQRS